MRKRLLDRHRCSSRFFMSDAVSQASKRLKAAYEGDTTLNKLVNLIR